MSSRRKMRESVKRVTEIKERQLYGNESTRDSFVEVCKLLTVFGGIFILSCVIIKVIEKIK